MSTQHTSTPWRIVEGRIIKQDYSHIGLGESAGVQIGSVCGHPSSGFYPTDEEAAANVAFIVKAVNAHAPLLAALKEARRAIGGHHAPNDCYATGPMTGDEYRDLVECPACSAIAMYDEAIAAAEGK